jgi:tetratricopeptide (TPR) repeat protein
MKRLRYVIIAVFFLSCLGPLLAKAQMGNSRFEAEFARTAEVIDRARSVVSDAKAEVSTAEIRAVIIKASALVDLAVNLQEEASGMGHNGRYLEGIGTTMKARDRAFEAINLVRRSGAKLANPADENENLVLRQLERTDDLLSKVQDQTFDSHASLFESLFNSAQESQRQAWEFYHNGQLRPALKLSRQAERILARMETRSVNDQTAQRLENRISQTERRLEQAESAIQNCGGSSSDARNLNNKALDEITKAKREAGRGNTDKAANAIGQAQSMLQKIAALCANGESLNRAIAQLKSEIDRLAPGIQGSRNAEATSLLEAARSYLRKAESYYSAGETDDCAANIKAAQMNLRTAERLAGL